MFLNGADLARLCDYSFGDHGGVLAGVSDAYIYHANKKNLSFQRKIKKIYEEKKKIVSLFIDTSRLYNPSKQVVKLSDVNYLLKLRKKSNLFDLIKKYHDLQFVIFTNLDDTEVTHEIHDFIPHNVIKVYATNAVGYYNKLAVAPMGVKRKMNTEDHHLEELETYAKVDDVKIKSLLYINFNESTNAERKVIIREISSNSFISFDSPNLDYKNFIFNLRSCAFVLCPEGNGLDTHRIWETLILGRVPVVKRTDFFMELLKGFPVLFVDNYFNLTKNYLESHLYLLKTAKKFDKKVLQTDYFYQNKMNEATIAQFR